MVLICRYFRVVPPTCSTENHQGLEKSRNISSTRSTNAHFCKAAEIPECSQSKWIRITVQIYKPEEYRASFERILLLGHSNCNNCGDFHYCLS